MPLQPVPLRFHIRWMIRRDLPAVLEIEQQAFPNAWSEEDFIRVLRRRICIGMVADVDDRVAGFVIFEERETRLHVLNLAVDGEVRRRGIGRSMIDRLKTKLSGRRRRILLEVRETNTAAQIFFRHQGFRAISVLRDFYDDASEDAYLMQFRQSEPLLANRIAGLEAGGCLGT